ncbi:MAG: 2-5 ligase [Bacteroidetes bacterium]|jgi:2'-5' RNA ligase|nr:2-5 ligase [Bacteroidota bacterium]
MLQKYFIAVVPPEPLLSEIHDIKSAIFKNYLTKGALQSPAHITLHMPFSFEEEKETKLISCLEAFRFDGQFQIVLDDYSCFEPRVVFINVVEQDKLFELQKQLVMHVKRQLGLFNQSDDLRGFHPHITVAFRDLKKVVFYKVWDEYQAKPFKAEFTCNSFSLLKHQKDHWTVLKDFSFLAES